MSRKERDRLRVISALKAGRLDQNKAAELLGIGVRQVRRSLRRFEAKGDKGLLHRLRGRPSNRKLDPKIERKALEKFRESYRDFGPTLAAEFLATRDGIQVGRETLRRWLARAGLRVSQRRGVKHRRWRERRPCLGELVQMDTSIHDWFEGRGETAVLIAMIDDATSRLEARFFAEDSTRTNLAMIGHYVRRQGVPRAIYADKASHFKTTRCPDLEEALQGRKAETQVTRALRELGVRYVAANSPQAKGRIERAFRTLQDRLVKELRLKGVSTIKQANLYVERKFLPKWNRDFTIPPAISADAHRPIDGLDLKVILAVQVTRTVANDFTVRHKGTLYQIEPVEAVRGLRKSKVLMEEPLEGRLRMRWRGRYLKFREVAVRAWREARTPGAAVGLRPPTAPGSGKDHLPPPDHPWRRTFLRGRKADISIGR